MMNETLSPNITPNKNRTNMLSRLLATEDIVVEHHSGAHTAMFDVKQRVLVLPTWKDMSTELYDMLVGHEVGHALYTPAEHDGQELPALLVDIAGNAGDQQLVKALLNIVEDARIERMMQDKFPGLKRDFVAAYDDLHNARDFFGVANKDVASLPFADRINLHFKIGNMVTVPFSTEEQIIIDRIANDVNTFGDVVELVREMYPSIQQEMDEQKQQQQEEVAASPNGEGESVPMSSENGEDTDDEGEGEGASPTSGDDTGDSMEDDTDDGESADSTQGEDSTSTGGDNDGQELPDGGSGLSTVDEFERNMSDMVEEHSRYNRTKYGTLGGFDYNEWIVAPEDTWKGMAEKVTEYYGQAPVYSEHREVASPESVKRALDAKVAKGANLLAKQFEMKKAADAHKRTTIAKTGVIDTVKMVNYKLTDDIFRRNSIIADGKNHGLTLFVDMSGSMSNCMAATLEQLYLLTTFCKKVNIPFDIYGFSSQVPWKTRYNDDETPECPITDNRPMVEDEYGYKQLAEDCDDIQPENGMCLYHMVSSTMKKREYKAAMTGLACYHHAWDKMSGYNVPRQLNLGGTPLDDCIVLARDLVNDFRKKNNLQVVHSIFLTDGDSHGGCVRHKTHLRDGRKVFETNTNGYGNTEMLLGWFRKTTGAKAIGLFLTASPRDMLYKMSRTEGYNWEQDAELKKQFTKQKFVNAGAAFGYTEFFILKSDTKVSTASLDDLADDASFARMKSAFLKSQNGSIVSRTVLNRVADLIAE